MLKECEDCIYNTTTLACFNCNAYKVDKAVTNINKYIEEENTDKFLFLFNNKYKDIINNNINTQMIECKFVSTIPEEDVCIIVDQKNFNKGNNQEVKGDE